MSIQAEPAPIELASAASKASLWWQKTEAALSWAGDRLNPILVKEARQALKSKQFAITFGLLLLLAWGGTIVYMAKLGSEAAYAADGPGVFFMYYIFLSFALLVIVPFGAFRSLAVEQEDRTYELLSITGLGPRQIVSGKLGSAIVQMLIYLSAMSPCLGFTYLLRGIDFPTILLVLFWLVTASLALSMIGLFLGTLAQVRHFQVILSVIFIIGLLSAFFSGLPMAGMFLWEMSASTQEHYPVYGAIITGFLCWFALFFYAAVAQITFASDNRSTRLRIVMMAHQMAFTGWIVYFMIFFKEADPEFWLFLVIPMGMFWFLMGALMSGESPELSLRVRRSLPQSFLGRALLTWFNPGPATGHIFIVANAVAAILGVSIALTVTSLLRDAGIIHISIPRAGKVEELLVFSVLGLCYLTIYLGIGLMLVRLARRFTRIDVVGSLLIHVVLVLVGCGLPPVIQMLVTAGRGDNWTILQIPCFIWTMAEAIDGPQRILPDLPTVLLLLVPAAVVTVVLNLRAVVHEIHNTRLEKPKRVAEEDASLAPPPPEPLPESPWD